MIYFCNTLYKANLGDLLSSPWNYFPVLQHSAWIDADDYPRGDVIFGGSGMIYQGYQASMIRASEDPAIKKIVWATGINRHGSTDVIFPQWLDKFHLVGLRDFGNPYEYVPCPSCLNAQFDVKRKSIVDEIVVFEHDMFPITLDGNPTFPRMKNGDVTSPCGFYQVLDFLAKGQIVITNSYHGTYWSMLLGQKVLLYKPWSSKFLSFKHPPQICDEHTWKEMCDESTSAPEDFLRECREVNRSFADRVFTLLQKAEEC